jgi:hypothetical protein
MTSDVANQFNVSFDQVNPHFVGCTRAPSWASSSRCLNCIWAFHTVSSILLVLVAELSPSIAFLLSRGGRPRAGSRDSSTEKSIVSPVLFGAPGRKKASPPNRCKTCLFSRRLRRSAKGEGALTVVPTPYRHFGRPGRGTPKLGTTGLGRVLAPIQDKTPRPCGELRRQPMFCSIPREADLAHGTNVTCRIPLKFVYANR